MSRYGGHCSDLACGSKRRETLALITILAPRPSTARQMRLAHRAVAVNAQQQFMVRCRWRELHKSDEECVWMLPNGRQDGICMYNMSPDDKYVDVCAYRNGVRHGRALAYFDSGQLYSRETYINNRLHDSTVYYRTGVVRSTCIPTDTHALQYEYNLDGKLIRRAKYVDGKIDGEETSFYTSERIRYRNIYVDGRLRSSFGYAETGELCWQTEHGDQGAVHSEYYPTGELRLVRTYNTESKLHGTSSDYYISGRLHKQLVFDCGSCVDRTIYDEDGTAIKYNGVTYA